MNPLEVVTHSHIDAEHAAGPHFPQATSADGRFSWQHSMPGYVGIRCEGTGLADNTQGQVGLHQVYLQYGEQDSEVSPELLALARAFSRAVDELRERRRAAAGKVEGSDPAIPAQSHSDAAFVWRGQQSMDEEDSIF